MIYKKKKKEAFGEIVCYYNYYWYMYITMEIPIICVLIETNVNNYDRWLFCQWLAAGQWFSPDTPISSIN
jgi:hypothetical protein